ncbi:STAS/SEC14 domain-containing protein [Paenarthrobacter sp. DKR-5]|uniref:DUF7793 family protein n=1 Tax=Paenarthrobacter sp. DKR-5 TaxID=2835535 RepID=UPI001BDCFDAF|nr:STAS/SEC14 domain-containing protein [Paenarthrobacter sp. DKR-5]MBT1004380.1 STAS/SEC14 domain-containing protein [Paenarthrobacter sp. DKR-5]
MCEDEPRVPNVPVVLPGGKAEVRTRPDGITHVVWATPADVEAEDAREVLDAVQRITGGTERPLLVDMRERQGHSAGSLRVFSGPYPASRVALLGNSPVDATIASFFIGVRKPPRPTRYFTSEAAAVAWLLGAPGPNPG